MAGHEESEELELIQENLKMPTLLSIILIIFTVVGLTIASNTELNITTGSEAYHQHQAELKQILKDSYQKENTHAAESEGDGHGEHAH